MVESFAAIAGGFDKDSQIFGYFALADIFAQEFRAQTQLELLVVFVG